MIEAQANGAWRNLEARLKPFVARRVRADADVDDVLQEVFLRLHRGLPALRDASRFGPFVYQVARSAIADHLRVAVRDAGRKAPEHGSEDPLEQLAADDAPSEDEGVRELAGFVGQLIAELPSPYREALTLTELQGISQKDAAQMLGVSLSGMKSRVQRGRARLRSMLDACCRIALDARGHVTECEPRKQAGQRACAC